MSSECWISEVDEEDEGQDGTSVSTTPIFSPKQHNFLFHPKTQLLASEEETGREGDGNGRKLSEKAGQRADRPNHCVVCFRPAHCYHFDVPSCLGCRSFFRRSIMQQRQYICTKGGNCAVQEGNICRSCRFDRCILAGMNVKAIRVISDRIDILQNITARLEGRRAFLLERSEKIQSSADSSKKSCELVPTSGMSRIMGEDGLNQKLLNSLLYVDEKLVRIRHSVTELGKHEYMPKGFVQILQDSKNILASAETFSKTRQIQHSLAFFMAQAQKTLHTTGPNWLFFDSFLCLELARTMEAVEGIPTMAKVQLLSTNILPTVVFNQSYYSLQTNEDLMLFPNGLTPIYFPDPDWLHRNKQKLFCRYLEPYKRIRLSREEFAIIRAILLLQPASIKLANAECDILERALEGYTRALMQLEQRNMGEVKGAQRFAELIFFLDEVRNIGNQHRQFQIYMSAVMKDPRFYVQPGYMNNIILGVDGN